MPRKTYVLLVDLDLLAQASMRPGLNAPENRFGYLLICFTAPCFNEAGAECPGKPPHVFEVFARLAASMRPGLNAPENRPF